jgi:hypothetical protein
MRVTVTRELDLSDLPDAPWRAALEDAAASHVYTYDGDDGRYVEIVWAVDIAPAERQTRDYPGCDAHVSGIYGASLHAHGKPSKPITDSLARAIADWIGESFDEDALVTYDDLGRDADCDDASGEW